MGRLEKILDIDRIKLQVDATSKKRVFELVGLLFEEANNLSRALVTECLMSRERLGSTGLGYGVAIPHGRMKGLKTPMAAVVQLKNPIPFASLDDAPVGFLYCLLVPENATQEHLDILSQVIGILRDPAKREQLLSLDNEDDIFKILTTSESAAHTPHP